MANISQISGNPLVDTGARSSIETTNSNVSDIQGKIPSQATAQNQLADKAFVNSSINAVAAYYITRTAQGDYFETDEQLASATVFYSGGQLRTPTRNDYTIVEASVSNATLYSNYTSWTDKHEYVGTLIMYDNSRTLVTELNYNNLGIVPGVTPAYYSIPSMRVVYNNQWEYQYQISTSGFTANQWAAINSGVTAGDVENIGMHIANTINPHSVTKTQVGLGNVDNKSVSTIKSEFTGSIASGDTGFPTGGAVFSALDNKADTDALQNYVPVFLLSGDDQFTATEKANARTNIGAGTSNLVGNVSYNTTQLSDGTYNLTISIT